MEAGNLVYNNTRVFTSAADALEQLLADTQPAICHPDCIFHRLPSSQLRFLTMIGAIDEEKTVCARTAATKRKLALRNEEQAKRVHIELVAEKMVERELRKRDEDACWSLGWVSLAAFLTCIAIVFISVHMSVTACRMDMLTHLREFPHNPLSALKPIKPGPGLHAGHTSHEGPFVYNGLTPPSEHKKCNS